MLKSYFGAYREVTEVNMKKIIAIIMALTVILSAGCSAKRSPEIVRKSDVGSDNLGFKVTMTLDRIGELDTDLFFGKVTSSKTADGIKFTNVGYPKEMETVTVYTVKVERAVWCSTVAEGDTIKLARFESLTEEVGWTEPFEKGKTYFFSAYAQTSSEGVVLLDMNNFTSEIDGDGRMIRMSQRADEVLKDVDTFDAFMASEPVQKLLGKPADNLPDCFYNKYEEETRIRVTDGGNVLIEKGEKQHPRDEVQGYVREAIKKGSSIKIEYVIDEYVID